jgi:ABC-type antimicrobial peptide transport system permease subunit
MLLGPRSIAVSHRVVLCIAQFPASSVGPDALLYEVKATDTCVLMGALFTMSVIAAVAAIVPVARALRIDPMAVLKAE